MLSNDRPVNDVSQLEERQGKMLLHTELSLLSILEGHKGVIQTRGLLTVGHFLSLLTSSICLTLYLSCSHCRTKRTKRIASRKILGRPRTLATFGAGSCSFWTASRRTSSPKSPSRLLTYSSISLRRKNSPRTSICPSSGKLSVSWRSFTSATSSIAT